MDDHDFMEEISLRAEGISEENRWRPSTPEAKQEYRDRMAMYADQSLNRGETEQETSPKYGFIAQDDETKRRLGLVMFLIRDMNDPTFQHFGYFDKFDRAVFPSDGRFCEIFELWTSPQQRRKGIASQLMMKAEEVALRHKVGMIYTHTEAINDHVVELCRKLGYEVLRRGELGGFERISQGKYLPQRGNST